MDELEHVESTDTEAAFIAEAEAAPAETAAVGPTEAAVIQKPKYTPIHILFDWLEAAIFALIAVTLIFSLCFRVVGVDGPSMMDTLMDKDRLLLQTTLYTPAHDDIVVILRDGDQKPLIKRVIGLPGDTIRLDVENDKVYRSINGGPEEVLVEPYVHYPLSWGIQWRESQTVTVPAGMLFVMGDHRDDSKDSRSGEVEFVQINHVVGKAFFRIFPIEKFGPVK